MPARQLGDRLAAGARHLEQSAVAAEHPQRRRRVRGDGCRGARPRAHRRRGPGGGVDQQLRLRRRRLGTAGHVDDAQHPARLRIVDRRRRARPGRDEPVEVLRAVDLHRAIERQRRPGGGGSHRLLRPVRARDEAHVAGEPADAAVALDPQQAPGGVADRDDDPGIRLGKQQRADHVHRAGQRVGAAVGLQLRVGEFQRRQRLGAHEARERPAPRILHERADVLQPGIIGVAADELFVRALDQQA